MNKKSWRIFKSNRGALASLLFLLLFVIAALLAPWFAPHDPNQIFEGVTSLPPFGFQGANTNYWLGTDDVGRDLLSRLIWGTRVSLGVGFLVVVLSALVGGLLGLCAGYFQGWFDDLVVRFVDIIMSLPSLLLAIVIVAILGPNLLNGILAVSFVGLPGFIRITRAAVMNEKEKLYVSAALGFGASDLRILFRSVLPNCLAPLIVQSSLAFSDGILGVAALGFLGLGAQPPTPEWGTMLADAKAYLDTAWWLVTLPGICIFAVVLCFNILGDGLRDALDPRVVER